VVAAARRGGVRFSVTARMDPAVRRPIGEDAWTATKYPNAIWEEAEQRWISDAEVAEIPFTAFTSRRTAEQVTARLIVRRAKRLNPDIVPAGRPRCRPVPASRGVHRLTAVDAGHRGRSPRSRDRRAGHRRARSGTVGAPAVGHVHRERRVAGLRGHRVQPHPRRRRPGRAFHAKARIATIRTRSSPSRPRIASSARRLRLHLPTNWPWMTGYDQLFTATLAPPGAVAA
jgi:hypothetical protein